MSSYQPPLTLTAPMLALVAEISEQVGRLAAQRLPRDCVAVIAFVPSRRRWPSRTTV